MAISSYKVGPGTLTIGSVGTPLDFTAQVTSCRVTPSVDKEDAVPTLSGESLSGARTYSWSLSGTVIQDLSDNGLIDYTWGNKGAEVPFTFTPSTAEGVDITGTVVVDPIEVGGDVNSKPTSDFEWEIVGDPVFAVGV